MAPNLKERLNTVPRGLHTDLYVLCRNFCWVEDAITMGLVAPDEVYEFIDDLREYFQTHSREASAVSWRA